MSELQMGAVEARFADIIWENEPIATGVLAKRSEELLSWKKTTSYTVLKRLCDKGIFKNEKGVVTSVMSREDFYAVQSKRFVEHTFEGSLPAFLAAFTKNKGLTAEEVAHLRQLVAEYQEE